MSRPWSPSKTRLKLTWSYFSVNNNHIKNACIGLYFIFQSTFHYLIGVSQQLYVNNNKIPQGSEMSFAQSHADKTMEEPNHKFQCSSIEFPALFETPHHLSIHRFNKYLLSSSSMPSTAPNTKDVILVRNSQRANNLIYSHTARSRLQPGWEQSAEGWGPQRKKQQRLGDGVHGKGKLPKGPGIWLRCDR